MMSIRITAGEAVDRATILQLKSRHAGPRDAQRLQAEHDDLWSNIETTFGRLDAINVHADRLLAINSRLWDLEDKIRTATGEAETATTGLAIADHNARRSAEKRSLDNSLGLEPEFKQYAGTG